MPVCTFGLSRRQVEPHAQVLSESSCIPWSVIRQAYKAIDDYDLRQQDLSYLKARLLDFEPPCIYRVVSPTILVYRFPNDELRYFLISRDNHLFEHASASIWFRFFPFIHLADPDCAVLDIERYPVLDIGANIAWLPQNPNYSHFLCDSFAPWLLFDRSFYIEEYQPKILQLQKYPSWQLPFVDRLGYQALDLRSSQDISLMVLRPKSVLFPVLSHALLAQYYLRNWLTKEFSAERHLDPIPILMLSRSDSRKVRIRNHDEIERLVLSRNGKTINPAAMSIPDKIATIGSADQIICEGSGSMNSVLFGSEKSLTLLLQDPSLTSDSLMLEGGFPYLHSIAHRMVCCPGLDSRPIPGSPLGSCYYPVSQINHILQSKFDSIR